MFGGTDFLGRGTRHDNVVGGARKRLVDLGIDATYLAMIIANDRAYAHGEGQPRLDR